MIKVAVMGYGIVGGGFIKVLDKNREINNKDIMITSILVRNIKKHKNKKYNGILTNDIEEFFSKESDIVIEVMGGVHPAYEYVKRALNNNKHVVTANKDLIAEYGEELFELAVKNNVSLKFEASVGGGITIIKPLTESLSGNNITEIKGILNGTTNFILSKMKTEEVSYTDALSEAQKLGFAEANPEADVEGYDSARKLSILSNLAYDRKVPWENQLIEGIAEIDLMDFKYAEMLNCEVKLVAYSKKDNNELFSAIRPSLVENGSILSMINNEVNAVILQGDLVGEISYIGKGAGELPTGSAVFGDVLDIIEKRFLNKVLLQGEEINISKELKGQCSALIRIITNNKKYLLNKIHNTFKEVKY